MPVRSSGKNWLCATDGNCYIQLHIKVVVLSLAFGCQAWQRVFQQ